MDKTYWNLTATAKGYYNNAIYIITLRKSTEIIATYRISTKIIEIEKTTLHKGQMEEIMSLIKQIK